MASTSAVAQATSAPPTDGVGPAADAETVTTLNRKRGRLPKASKNFQASRQAPVPQQLKPRGTDHFLNHQETIEKLYNMLVNPATRKKKYKVSSIHALHAMLAQHDKEFPVAKSTLVGWFTLPGAQKPAAWPQPTHTLTNGRAVGQHPQAHSNWEKACARRSRGCTR